jgi:hypothetical protein
MRVGFPSGAMVVDLQAIMAHNCQGRGEIIKQPNTFLAG